MEIHSGQAFPLYDSIEFAINMQNAGPDKDEMTKPCFHGLRLIVYTWWQ